MRPQSVTRGLRQTTPVAFISPNGLKKRREDHRNYLWGDTRMERSSPSLQEWRALYRAALEFKGIKSWDWMFDSDVFGVQNPESGEIGYCCVMGRLGEVFGLAVYLGTDGLDGYLKIQAGEILAGDMEALTIQKCLLASFEDRKDLKKPDLEVIKELGLRFRGRKAWPLFRSYRPGYAPWYLTAAEAGYLTLVLQQAIEVCLRFKEDPGLLIPPEESHYFVRVPERAGDGWKWRDEWLEPEPPPKNAEVVEIDEALLESIKGRAYSRQGVWEMGIFYFPGAVKGGAESGERPYYPYVFLWADHNSGFVLNCDIVKPWEYKSEFPGRFLKLVERMKFLPKEILVSREEAFRLFAPITSKLGIQLRRVPSLRAIEEAQASMYEYFT